MLLIHNQLRNRVLIAIIDRLTLKDNIEEIETGSNSYFIGQLLKGIVNQCANLLN
jgi:hypothetical protein